MLRFGKMADDETQLAVIVAALRRRSARSLLQRRVTNVVNQIEALLTTGWSIPELAEHLAAGGVTQRNGRRLSAGHFGVLVTRARAKARAASRPEFSTADTSPAKAICDARYPNGWLGSRHHSDRPEFG